MNEKKRREDHRKRELKTQVQGCFQGQVKGEVGKRR
jgi:hypothetical protein